jgi:hypothetical protein
VLHRLAHAQAARSRCCPASDRSADAALDVFFDELGDQRAALLTHVSADMADWIARVGFS